jgi:hypothetical protein
MSEKVLQAVLIRRALTKLHHQIVLPNDTSFYSWEADLITVNNSGYVNEFECKISRADFLRDCKKYKFKHFEMFSDSNTTPNYFWYATLDFDIEVPEFAGWLKVVYLEKRGVYDVKVMKPAPLRHKQKPHERKIKIASRLLSFKLMGFYDPYMKPIRKDLTYV